MALTLASTLADLTLVANKLGFSVDISFTQKSSFCDATYKLIVLSSSQMTILSEKYAFDLHELNLCCLAHEVGHAIAWDKGDNFYNEVTAWAHAATLFEVLPPSFPKIRKGALSTYLRAYGGSEEAYMKEH